MREISVTDSLSTVVLTLLTLASLGSEVKGRVMIQISLTMNIILVLQ